MQVLHAKHVLSTAQQTSIQESVHQNNTRKETFRPKCQTRTKKSPRSLTLVRIWRMFVKPAKIAGFLSSTVAVYLCDCRKPSIRASATLNQAFCVLRYLSHSV